MNEKMKTIIISDIEGKAKSITPGNVLSHDRIMAREQSRACKYND
jgi:hypothetical protein